MVTSLPLTLTMNPEPNPTVLPMFRDFVTDRPSLTSIRTVESLIALTSWGCMRP